MGVGLGALWTGLPLELREEVLAFLPLQDRGRLMRVCREWKRLLSVPARWQNIRRLSFHGTALSTNCHREAWLRSAAKGLRRKQRMSAAMAPTSPYEDTDWALYNIITSTIAFFLRRKAPIQALEIDIIGLQSKSVFSLPAEALAELGLWMSDGVRLRLRSFGLRGLRSRSQWETRELQDALSSLLQGQPRLEALTLGPFVESIEEQEDFYPKRVVVVDLLDYARDLPPLRRLNFLAAAFNCLADAKIAVEALRSQLQCLIVYINPASNLPREAFKPLQLAIQVSFRHTFTHPTASAITQFQKKAPQLRPEVMREYAFCWKASSRQSKPIPMQSEWYVMCGYCQEATCTRPVCLRRGLRISRATSTPTSKRTSTAAFVDTRSSTMTPFTTTDFNFHSCVH